MEAAQAEPGQVRREKLASRRAPLLLERRPLPPGPGLVAALWLRHDDQPDRAPHTRRVCRAGNLQDPAAMAARSARHTHPEYVRRPHDYRLFSPPAPLKDQVLSSSCSLLLQPKG